MQLAELALLLIAEAESSRDDLFVTALELSALEDDDSSEAALGVAATTYADFCERTASAVESINLTGLSQAARLIGEGVGMVPGLPLELRAPAGPLLSYWPEFFMEYLRAWTVGAPDEATIVTLLGHMAQAEFVTPLDETQLTQLGAALMSPPPLQEQQAAMTLPFLPPSEEAMSLALPADAEQSVIEGFLAEGPGQVERLVGAITALARASASAQQLELAHRAAHTLKGTAAIAGIRGIATLAHALEDLLELFREQDFVAPDGLLPVMLAGCDQLDLGLVHLAEHSAAPENFGRVTLLVHAWASHLCGLDVPQEALDISVLSHQPVQQASAAMVGTAAVSSPEATAEEEAQIRIPAKVLDKIFRVINELAIGNLRLRTQTDELMTRAASSASLEQTANLRLAEIERRVTLEGLGRVAQSRGSSAGSASAPAGEFDAIELDKYNELAGATQALAEAIGDIRNAREDLMPALRQVTALSQRQLEFAREARYQITQARLRPLSDLRSRLRRTVRQTSSVLGKEVNLEITGDDLRVDAAVLEPLSEALLHLLRNSVDHGIEDVATRIAAGKPAVGTVQLSFSSQSGGVVTTLRDDGQGLDHDAIFDKAVWSGLIAPEAKLSREEIQRLIFLPGFSTRSSVTETSGRGVGLDAVTQALSSLQGNVSVRSDAGAGTAFRLFALATVGTIHALHVEADGEHFLIPSIQLVRADAAGGVINTLDAPVQDIWLPGLLHGNYASAPAVPEDRPGLVIDVDGSLRRIGVNRIFEAREFLIAPTPELISRLPGISGVTTLADGSLGVVLDLLDLSRKQLPVRQDSLRDMKASVQEQKHILVVDDSASVRNTISALLRDENYKVTVARDGLAGMQACIDHRFDLVLTDLEMPELNGFELTEFIRNRSEQRSVPVVLLTSRGQDKHRQRGEEAGVSAFMVKPYADHQLLETIRKHVGATEKTDRPERRDKNALYVGA
ncbi:MAG: hypothetical protein CFE39_03650 [Comamonadaceae bacterium PBBC2]|nr:MAG: hypothetical protein CFE39_03650 [Comamonadaceae bacterium PBBC2]